MTLQVSATEVVKLDRSFVLGTATPGSPLTGMIRYNNSLAVFEVYNGTAWVGIITVATATPPAWTFGRNYRGQLGDNTVTQRTSPVSVVGGITSWAQIGAGNQHSVAIRTNGQAWAWGYNAFYGALGDGTSTNRSSPVSVVGGFTNWARISAGRNHNAGLRANGQAWCWGQGTNGQLGDGAASNRSSPVSVVGGFTDWVQISAGTAHTVGLRANGQAWAWGANSRGQLGDGTASVRSSPVSVVGGFTDWVQISAAKSSLGEHTAGIRSNGQAWCWGANSFGQSGDGTASSRSSPVSVVGGFTDWVQISANQAHTAAVRSNGQAWCWGSGANGRLGDGTTASKSSPVSVVGGFTDWVQIATGQRHTMAIRANGQLWGWGAAGFGQLGTGNTTYRSSPVSVVGGFTDWVQISGGLDHTVALRSV